MAEYPTAVIIAQSLKGSFAARSVGSALRRGLEGLGVGAKVILASDGGDGFLDSLPLVERERVSSSDPLLRPIQAEVGWLDDATAAVESRLACGLSLLQPSERNPLVTSTRGVGQLIDHAVAKGARRIWVGLGGSATMDGGVGMARAWGWEALDHAGEPLPDGGGSLHKLSSLRAGRTPEAEIVALTDVQNPLIGDRGARVYASQKGASPAAEDQLAAGLARVAETAAMIMPNPPVTAPGSGAAGGLAFGLAVFGGARLEAGAPWVLAQAGFDAALAGASVVLVVEGAFDRTSLEGKLTGEVIGRARSAGVPLLLLSPSATDVPRGVEVETGGGEWSLQDLERHAAEGVARVLRLSRP